MTDAALGKLRELEKDATPGKWEQFNAKAGQRSAIGVLGGGRNIRIADVGDRQLSVEQINADAKFIAAARNAMPELLAEVDRLRAVEAGTKC